MNIRIEKIEKSNFSERDECPGLTGPFSDHMFIADYKNGSWIDHRIIPTGPLPIHPGNATFHYGQAFFEGMKAFKQADGKINLFRPELNAQRATESAERLTMPPFPQDDFINAVKELVNLDRQWVPSSEKGSLYIRPFMIATDTQIGVKPSETYSFIILTTPAIGGYYTKPLNVLVEKEFSRSGPGCPGYAKAAGNYAGSYMPAKKAQEEGYDQLIWTDAVTHTNIEESGTMNIAAIIKGVLISPPPSDTILAGTTVRTLFEIAKTLNIPTERRNISVTELTKGIQNGSVTEVFGCGTAVVISPFKTITHEGKKFTLPDETPLSSQLKDSLKKIRTGELKDSHNWVHSI